MERYDIFVCYRGESTLSTELGSQIYSEIDRDVADDGKYNVFFAPKCIEKGTNFKAIIPEIMQNISIVILLLDTNFFKNYLKKDDIVAYELREALKNENIMFLPVLLNNFNMQEVNFEEYGFSEQEAERIKHINSINYNGIYNFTIKNDLLPIITGLYDGGETIKNMRKRGKHRYYGASDEEEVEFLALQQEMMYDFDQEVYDKILAGKEKMTILDVGCNNGAQIMAHFGNDPRVTKVLGIDKDEASIQAARAAYPNAGFGKLDVESSNFRNALKAFLKEQGVEKFDMINVSMVLLHLERPSIMLGILRGYLKEDGVLFIRDIDDGMNLAHPDTKGDFARMIEICSYCDMLGYRKSGRQVYSYLKSAGFNHVKLEKIGLSTANMSYDQRCALFDVYFGYIPTALEKTIERDPSLFRAKHDYEWVQMVRDNVYEEFLNNQFLFSLGYMIFTASQTERK